MRGIRFEVGVGGRETGFRDVGIYATMLASPRECFIPRKADFWGVFH
jgi:hypothetical protein